MIFLCSSLQLPAQCVRCDKQYDTLKNLDQACIGHFDRFGKKGEWRVIVDSSSSSDDDDNENEDGDDGGFLDDNNGGDDDDDDDDDDDGIDYGHGNKELDEVLHIVVREKKKRKQRKQYKKEKKEKEKEEGGGQKRVERGVWSCCQSNDKYSEGCNKEPHQMRKIMFALTMDANPTVRIEDNTTPGSPCIDLGVINALSISFYPEDKNEIKVIHTHTYSYIHIYICSCNIC